LEYVNCYHAPELCETVVNEVLTVNKSLDIWSLGKNFEKIFQKNFRYNLLLLPQRQISMAKSIDHVQTLLGMGAMAET
jgi:hypothetical protein